MDKGDKNGRIVFLLVDRESILLQYGLLKFFNYLPLGIDYILVTYNNFSNFLRLIKNKLF